MLAQVSFWCRCCALPVLALALVGVFAPTVRGGVIVQMGAADMAAACVEPARSELPGDDAPQSERKWSALDQIALYGNGGAESSGSQSGSSSSSSLSSQSSSAVLPLADDAAHAGGQWRCVTELLEPPVVRGVLDSVFHPPRAAS